MASLLHFSPILLTIYLHTLLTSPAHSLTCTSQTFTKTTPHYTNCTDLPALKAYLHWAYDPTNSSLSLAFIAQPAKPDGWIAWGINPTTTGMVGAQTLIALRDSNGSLVVKTYDLISYMSIEETSNLSFKVLDSKVENVNGTMKIFATLALPENTTVVNQVWQVGGSVKDSRPQKHDFAPENLSAKSTLELVKVVETNGTAVETGGPNGADKNVTTGGGGVSQSGNVTGGGSRVLKCDRVVYGFLVFFGLSFLGF